MAMIKPFAGIRPNQKAAKKVAALPYDVYSRAEAKKEIEKEPLSFLKIDRAEILLPETVDSYDPFVYETARVNLEQMRKEGIFIQDETPCFYLYQLKMGAHRQIGVVGCAAIDDYLNHKIKQHEDTRKEKEEDRIRHVETLHMQTGPIFLTYQTQESLQNKVECLTQREPIYNFISKDGIEHTVWKIEDEASIKMIEKEFEKIPTAYIADGHHRAAAAVKVGLKLREEKKEDALRSESDYFLSVWFPHSQLKILDYNRVVKDLNGLTKLDFLKKVEENFQIEKIGLNPYKPMDKGNFGMYLEGEWYHLKAEKRLYEKKDCVASLDVSVLQDYILGPILGILDPRTSHRIDFVGGIRGLKQLEHRVNTDMAAAFSFYPTSIEEMMSVAEEEKKMPPKSTWFEPKLRSGLFLHQI